MSYLKFDKTILINLEESLQREILRTNRGGAYCSTTIVDCNTSKYHGLLICPVPGLDSDNHVLLSSLDTTIIQHGAEFNLGVHQYAGGYISPNGQKYIRKFEFESVPKTIYRVGGVIFAKEKVFMTFENRILIKYTLLDAHSPTILKIKPFLVFRNINSLTYANSVAKQDYSKVDGGIKICMYEGYPYLYMQFNKSAHFVFQPYWYKEIEYSKELEMGLAYKEDLYVPGYFELDIQKGESIYFSGGDTFIDPVCIVKKYYEEAENRTSRTSFYNCLKNSAQQFYYRPTENDAYLLAGYPWFKVRARDLFLSMPGCSLSIDDPTRFEKLMDTAMLAIRQFMKGNSSDQVIQEIEKPDVLLWAIWALQEYAKYTSLAKCNERYGEFIQEMVQYILINRHPNLILKPNGLLYTYGKTKAVTWMNSTVEGKPIIPRSGYIVEFNSLWFNALHFAIELARLNHKEELVGQLKQRADQTKSSFVATFLNEQEYLYDHVDKDYISWSVRPNMLFAVSLDYSPLNRIQKHSVLNIITKELLTPKGIRSLSPRSTKYCPHCTGSQYERNLAYHQGTVWPWLLGFYLEAYLKFYPKSGLSFVERMLIGIEEEMNLHCLGSLSELFDGNPPFKSRGATSFALNVAAILHVLKLLENYKSETKS